MRTPLWLGGLLLLLSTTHAPAAPEGSVKPRPAEKSVPASLPKVLSPQDWLVLPRVGDYRRSALHVDPVEALVATGRFKPPEPGGRVAGAEWRSAASADSVGTVGGYAFAEFESPVSGVMLLEANGAAAVCLNGEWIPGDPYGFGWFRPPTKVRAGKNWLLVHLARPDARPRLLKPQRPVTLLAGQATLPDLVAGESAEGLVASIPLSNASDDPLTEAVLSVSWEGGPPSTKPIRFIDARLVTPIAFELPEPIGDLEAGVARRLLIEVLRGDDAPAIVAGASVEVAVAAADAARTNTFLSAIDGAVQPYRVLPSTEADSDGLLVVLHDAGQTPRECLAEWRPQPSATLLAPRGRGRWAFDWEDWSRLDAFEAIDDYTARRDRENRPCDPARVSLIGCGMGGHGALSLGAMAPDRFASVGVVDPWISFYTLGSAVATPAHAGPIEKLLGRQAAANDPLRTIENVRGRRVSLLYTGGVTGSPNESRFLRGRLAEFHDDFAYRESSAGVPSTTLLTEQADWLLARRVASGEEQADQVVLATPDVGALSQRGWVTLLGVDRAGDPARVEVRRDAANNEVSGSTENVRRLRLDFSDWTERDEKRSIRIRLDGGRSIVFRPGNRGGDAIALARDGNGDWSRVRDLEGRPSRFATLLKGPERSGGFKKAFTQRPVLVYGTGGSDSERAWAAAKARYDAHLFLYRGAGRLEVVPDKRFASAARGDEGPDSRLADGRRSVVLYGAQHTNSLWSLLRQEAFVRRSRTIRIDEGLAWFGQRPESGDDLAVLALRPRPGQRRSYLAVVGGTGLTGMRLTTRLRYFWSGLAYPDFMLFGPACLAPPEEGSPFDDVRAAGYFDADWGVDEGGVLWRDLAI